MSPDLNALNLGFFNSLQSVHCRNLCHSYQQLCKNVQSAFVDHKIERVGNIWLTLKAIYNQFMKEKGSSKYTLPHIHKQKLKKKGQLPSSMTICSNAYAVIKEHKESLEEENRKRADIDHALQQADNVVDI